MKEVAQEQSQLDNESENVQENSEQELQKDQTSNSEKPTQKQPSNDEESFGGFDNADDGFGGWDDEEVDLDEPEQEIENVNEALTTKADTPPVENISNTELETPNKPPSVKEEEDGDGWGGWDDEDLDLGDDSEAKPDDNDTSKKKVNFAMESQVPSAIFAPKEILSHEEPPASLISNVSGWGDDDGFGWGNEEDLPGNLRLSEERDIVEKREIIEKEGNISNKTQQPEVSPISSADETMECKSYLVICIYPGGLSIFAFPQ